MNKLGLTYPEQLNMKNQQTQKHSVESKIRFATRKYEPEFKRKVAIFAERRGNQEAKRRFGVSESNIRRWKKIHRDHLAEKGNLKNVVGNKNLRPKNKKAEEIPNIIGMK